jgi:hypothetical protein
VAPLSPTGLLVAAVGAVIGYLSGGGVAGAIVLGAIAWGGFVAIGRLRRPRAERIDPFTVQDPWRAMIMRAQSTANRFDAAVRKAAPGPLKDRLVEVQGRVGLAVREAWAIAKRGHALDDAVKVLDLPRIRRSLEAATDEAVAQSLRAQLAAGERLATVAGLNAELDESVARAVELSVASGDVTALQPLGRAVEEVVGELESLRLALEETG